MTNYLIRVNNACEHYFYRPYEGICMRVQNPNGKWQEHKTVLEHGNDGFGVYADKHGCVHLICVNNKNELVYTVRKQGVWKKHILSQLGEDIYVSDMRLYSIKDRLNLIYSALYNGENLLIHCILGDHAKPSSIGASETSHFFIYGGKVYYTNTFGNLGYSSLADEKPSEFIKIYNDAHCASINLFADKEFTVFTRESKLFLNGSEILYDSRMEMPFCITGSDRLFIMWKSGSFVRYITSANGGISWSDPMRFMSNGSDIAIFLAQQNDYFAPFYGYCTDNDIILLGKPNIFSTLSDFRVPQLNELEKLRAALFSAQNEINETKQDIKRLNSIICGLKDFTNK